MAFRLPSFGRTQLFVMATACTALAALATVVLLPSVASALDLGSIDVGVRNRLTRGWSWQRTYTVQNEPILFYLFVGWRAAFFLAAIFLALGLWLAGVAACLGAPATPHARALARVGMAWVLAAGVVMIGWIAVFFAMGFTTFHANVP